MKLVPKAAMDTHTRVMNAQALGFGPCRTRVTSQTLATSETLARPAAKIPFSKADPDTELCKMQQAGCAHLSSFGDQLQRVATVREPSQQPHALAEKPLPTALAVSAGDHRHGVERLSASTGECFEGPVTDYPMELATYTLKVSRASFQHSRQLNIRGCFAWHCLQALQRIQRALSKVFVPCNVP